MGFMNWLMKGVGFENEEVYDDSMEKQTIRDEKRRKKEEERRKREEYKAQKAQEKADKFAKRYSLKQEKDIPEKTPQGTVSYTDNPDQYNTSSSYSSPSSSSYGMGSNVGGYGSKNVEFVYPQKFDDVQFVMNYLKEGESVMLNLNSMNEYDSQRLLDCTYGAIYALNGSIQRVENNIFLLMPEGYSIRTHEQKPQQ